MFLLCFFAIWGVQITNRTEAEDAYDYALIAEQGARSVPMLQERLEDEWFCRLQGRRSQMEARIGIFKNVYLGRPLRSKGFANRECRIGWCVLAHNLWKLDSIADMPAMGDGSYYRDS